MVVLIEGKKVSDVIKERIKGEVFKLGEPPCLHTILVGDDPASQSYVRSKKKTCESLGMRSVVHHLPEATSLHDLKMLIQDLNAQQDVNGILVQLPLPVRIDKYAIIEMIGPLKDVDGLTPCNLARLDRGRDCLEPCTPKGIVCLLDYWKMGLEGANAVIVGRSDIVGKPLGKMMLNRNATVTLCHSKTKNLDEIMAGADILVSAVGKPCWVKKKMVKQGAVVIDVGINRVGDVSSKTGYRLVGDVEFDDVSSVAGYLTPVPGGIGPMTIACLMENTLKAYKLQRGC